MTSIRVRDNSRQLIDKLAAFASGQLPFAMAQTLSQVAYEVRDQEKNNLDRYFKLRTRWSRNSIKVVRAEKKDFPAQKAIVGIRDKVLALNITGGTRKNESGGNVAIPSASGRSVLNPGKETLGPARFPGKVIRQRRKYGGSRPFLMKSKSGDEVVAIRTGQKRTPLTVLYRFKKSANVKKKWPFVRNAQIIVRREYKKKLSYNISKAIKNAR